MRRTPNRVGGGAQTNVHGLRFEKRADLRDAIKAHPSYELNDGVVYDSEGVIVARYFEKHGLYKKFLEPKGIDYRNIISTKLLPDGALLVGNTMYIIEKKYQIAAGSVSEKLQTCDFKKKQYQKLFSGLGIDIQYYYVLNEWFDQPIFGDVFDILIKIFLRLNSSLFKS